MKRSILARLLFIVLCVFCAKAWAGGLEPAKNVPAYAAIGDLRMKADKKGPLETAPPQKRERSQTIEKQRSVPRQNFKPGNVKRTR